MRTFEKVKLGYEIEFIGSDDKIERGIVNGLDGKKFTVEVLKYSNYNKNWYTSKMSWFLSGKKTSRFYNYGNALRIVNEWK